MDKEPPPLPPIIIRSMPKHKIHVVGGNTGYANWLNCDIVATIEAATLVMFTGGADINSRIYNRKRNINHEPYIEERDQREIKAFMLAQQLKVPMLGICRGAQLLCALNGGVLIQHMDGHRGGTHLMTTNDGKKLTITTCHHQCAYPFVEGCEHKLIAWANGLAKFYDGEEISDQLVPPNKEEPEIVYYPKSKALGIQGHPEWMHGQTAGDVFNSMTYLRGLVRDLVEERI